MIPKRAEVSDFIVESTFICFISRLRSTQTSEESVGVRVRMLTNNGRQTVFQYYSNSYRDP